MSEPTHNFKVNLAGIIDILSKHLYSEPKVFVRELLQNATDAVRARQLRGDDFLPRVHVELIPGTDDAPPQIVFEDNGIGLTQGELHEFVASIGASSKKRPDDLRERRDDFIGQFGIGLLSCFMVTDEIVMTTHSASGGPALAWYGNEDGSYRIRELTGSPPVGTRVYLKGKPEAEEFFTAARLRKLLAYYGAMLPFAIYFNDETEPLNDDQHLLFADAATEDELLAYGEEQFGTEFLAALPLRAGDGQTTGVAYILPYAPNPSRKTTHKVYLRRMLISESVDNILPEWAFFVKCIINTEQLRPTASRESFYEDQALLDTREELGRQLKRFIVRLADADPKRLQIFLRTHHLAVKMLAVHDDEFFELIVPYLTFDTSLGPLKLSEITRNQTALFHTTDYNEYQQLNGIAGPRNVAVVNTSFTYNLRLLQRYGERYGYETAAVTTDYFIRQFAPLSLDERARTGDFLKTATEVLKPFNCEPVIRKFEPADVPTIYYMDEHLGLLRSIRRSQESTTNVWAGILENIVEAESDQIRSKMCFNYLHPLFQRLLDHPERTRLAVRILYVQALMLGRHPLNKNELNILSEGMIELLINP